MYSVATTITLIPDQVENKKGEENTILEM